MWKVPPAVVNPMAGLGRVLLSLIFVMSGIHKITAWEATATQMESAGMVAVPLFLTGAIVFEVLGGLSVMLGIQARLGALALVVFLIPTTLIFHDFWRHEGQEQQVQMIQFVKNLAILGGVLLVASLGPGGCCVFDKQKAEASGTGSH